MYYYYLCTFKLYSLLYFSIITIKSNLIIFTLVNNAVKEVTTKWVTYYNWARVYIYERAQVKRNLQRAFCKLILDWSDGFELTNR